jgi:hypothetical protein
MSHAYTEDQLVEQPAIGLFAAMGWQTISALEETFGTAGTLGRETKSEVVLVERLRIALTKLGDCPHVVKAVNDYLITLYDVEELSSEATIRKFQTVQTEGNRQVSRLVAPYRLDDLVGGVWGPLSTGSPVPSLGNEPTSGTSVPARSDPTNRFATSTNCR